jgi:serine/threonine-protein kinase
VAIPDVKAQSPADAQAALEGAGFAVNVKHQYDESVPVDGVIGTDPAIGGSAPRDSTLQLLVSDGPAPVAVPDVSTKSFDDASTALTAAGFTVARSDDFNATVPSGKVIGTDPPAGTEASRGSAVTVHVSKGPETVKIPNLVGQSLDAAQAQLQAAGFVVDTQSYLPGRVVRAQDPAAGTTVNKGTKVTLFF